MVVAIIDIAVGPGGGFGGPGCDFAVLVAVVAGHCFYYYRNHPQDHQNHHQDPLMRLPRVFRLSEYSSRRKNVLSLSFFLSAFLDKENQ